MAPCLHVNQPHRDGRWGGGEEQGGIGFPLSDTTFIQKSHIPFSRWSGVQLVGAKRRYRSTASPDFRPLFR